MERMELEELVQSLQKRAERLERRQGLFLAGAFILLAVFLLTGWQSVQAPQENLKTHALSIVDSSGVVRLTLGAPVPNPVVEGKTKERRSPATGIIFSDAEGNERGGIGMLDDGSMNFCFDDAKTERNCLFFMPKFGNGIAFNDASGESRAILYLDTNGAPHLLLRDDQGPSLVSLPEAPKGSGVK
ncbi:MAG TPA: hypothetical protein VJW93_12975 [Candidatus Acidoferrales bacterium]|nr:hypothetical protein [Candidatus Acidoferrales bacterium]